MPGAYHSIDRRVLAHWTDPNSVLEFHSANFQRREELRSHVENPISTWQTHFMDASSSMRNQHSFRIDDKSVIRGRAVTITIDESEVSAFEGESVASVMMVEGKVAMRTTTDDQPRGVFCGMGVCFDCLVIVDDVPNTRACMTWVKEGMRVKTQKGLSV